MIKRAFIGLVIGFSVTFIGASLLKVKPAEAGTCVQCITGGHCEGPTNSGGKTCQVDCSNGSCYCVLGGDCGGGQ